jgi:hypothetical protein
MVNFSLLEITDLAFKIITLFEPSLASLDLDYPDFLFEFCNNQEIISNYRSIQK